jgi:hypothetical protein
MANSKALGLGQVAARQLPWVLGWGSELSSCEEWDVSECRSGIGRAHCLVLCQPRASGQIKDSTEPSAFGVWAAAGGSLSGGLALGGDEGDSSFQAKKGVWSENWVHQTRLGEGRGAGYSLSCSLLRVRGQQRPSV